MPETRFNAFLSCSLERNDKEVLEFFKKLIESFDIDPEVYDYQEPGRVPEMVQKKITACDCLIAIATRRNKIEGSTNQACPDWIQQEIVLAHAHKKPIAIFIEDGVQILGLIDTEERKEKFKRDDLLWNFDKLVKFLFKFRKHLETSPADSQPIIMTRHYVHVDAQMRSKEELVISCEILMESLIPQLEAVPHVLELDDTTPGLSVKPKDFKFACHESPSGAKVHHVVQQSTDNKFFFVVTFDPPLKTGEKVKYAYKEVIPNSRPFTLEELQDRITKETYKYKEQIIDACAWTITYPTYELKYSFEFPDDYQIQKYYPDVKMGRAKIPAKEELNRIRAGNLFTADRKIDKWRFSLTVLKPLVDHTYYMFYVPPSIGKT